MRNNGTEGVTLVELVITVSIVGIIASAASALMLTGLQAYETGTATANLYHEGYNAMERMTSGVRRSTIVLIPNGNNTTRDLLAISGSVNDDDDYYFDDTLFPRIDEDPGDDMDESAESGIKTIDDDGDGGTDESGANDDDEDGASDEEIYNGLDDDGDGSIDEDTGDDMNLDGQSGFASIDDDGDGAIDEADPDDDDEDGSTGEDRYNPTMFALLNGNELHEIPPPDPATANPGTGVLLSEHVTSFLVTFDAPERVLIELTLTGDNGDEIEFAEYAFPRNTYQWNGKRVN